jgi:hypothetical protein
LCGKKNHHGGSEDTEKREIEEKRTSKHVQRQFFCLSAVIGVSSPGLLGGEQLREKRAANGRPQTCL